jgi:hypothetical protein
MLNVDLRLWKDGVSEYFLEDDDEKMLCDRGLLLAADFEGS